MLKRFIIFIAIAITFMGCKSLLSPDDAGNEYKNGVWVSADEGNDTTGNGSIGRPYKTLAKGLGALGGKKNELLVVEGTYTESLTIGEGIVLTGGYSKLIEGKRSREPGKFETIISPSPEGTFALKFTEGKGKMPSKLSGFTLGVMWKQVPAIIEVDSTSPTISANRINVGGGSISSTGINITAVKGDAKPVIEGNEITIHGTTSKSGFAVGMQAVSLEPGREVRPAVRNNVFNITGLTATSGTVAGIDLRKETNDAKASLDMEGNRINCAGKNCSASFFYGILLGESPYGSVFSFDEAVVNGNRIDGPVAVHVRKGNAYLSNNIIKGGKGGALITVKNAVLDMDFNTVIAGSSCIDAGGGAVLNLMNNIFEAGDGVPVMLTGAENSLKIAINNLFSPADAACMIRGTECMDDGFMARNIRANAVLDQEGKPITGSAAIDGAECLLKVITQKDINGTKRPSGSKCDIGASEFMPSGE